MSESREFCPRCGSAVEPREEPLPGQPRDRDAKLCNDCYFEDFDLVDAPDRIEIQVCSGCGAVHRGNRWVDVGARDYTDVAVDAVTEELGVHVNAADVRWGVEPEQVDPTTIRMHCEFSGIVRGTLRQESVTVPVKIGSGTCSRCGRIAGGYYASVVQIRADDRVPASEETARAVEIAESYVAAREDTGSREDFITEVTETDDGVDIKLSTNQLGRGVSARIVEELGGTVEDHATLVTEDEDGNEVYRVTFAVRLPRYRPGDVIDVDETGPVLVRSVRGNLKGVRLTTGEEYEADYEEGIAPDARKLGTREEGEETTVVTVEDDRAVQVLDPETYEAKTVSRPDYVPEDAETVEVLKSRTGLHVLPADEADAAAGGGTES